MGFGGIPPQGVFPRNPSKAASLLDLPINVKLPPYNASGSSATTTGSMTSGSKTLTITGALPTGSDAFKVGQGISVAGAGASAALLVSTIDDISGTSFTLADAAGTTVSGATVSHDDTAAVQASIDAVESSGYGVCYFPTGTYLISTGLVQPPGVVLRGDGTGATLLKMADNTNITMVINRDGATTGDDYLFVESLTLDCNKANNSTGAGIAWTQAFVNSRIRDVLVLDAGAIGIALINCSVVLMDNCWINGSGTDGVQINDSTRITCVGCASENSGSNDWHFNNGRGDAEIILVGCSAENCPTAYYIDGTNGVGLVGCYAGGGTGGTDAILLDSSTVTNWSITDFTQNAFTNIFHDTNGSGFILTAADVPKIDSMAATPRGYTLNLTNGSYGLIFLGGGAKLAGYTNGDVYLNYGTNGASAALKNYGGGTTILSEMDNSGNVMGAFHYQSISPSATTIGTGGTIPVTFPVMRVTTTAAATGAILHSGGTLNGAVIAVTVVNESTNSITFSASGTSNVADGASDVIAANTAARYVWDSGTSLWYRI